MQGHFDAMEQAQLSDASVVAKADGMAIALRKMERDGLLGASRMRCH